MTTTPRKPIDLSTKTIAIIMYVFVTAVLVIFKTPLEKALAIALFSLPISTLYGACIIGDMLGSLNEKGLKRAVLGWTTGFFVLVGIFLIAGGIHEMHLGIFLTGVATFGIACGLIHLYPDAQ